MAPTREQRPGAAAARDLVLHDLAIEGGDVDDRVQSLGDEGWSLVTTREGWTVAHQIAHLTWTDHTALLAFDEPIQFAREVQTFRVDPEGYTNRRAEEWSTIERRELLDLWRNNRHQLLGRLSEAPLTARLPWFGPSMSVRTMALARFMETWAHGFDITEAAGLAFPRRESARHVAELGARTRRYSFAVRDEPFPEAEIRIELTGPAGQLWSWGPENALEQVRGDGFDFALLVTRRRHAADLDVDATGPGAVRWLQIAQAFAGPSGADPERSLP